MKQIVKNNKLVVEINEQTHRAHGVSAAPKGVIFHALDNSKSISVLDIGFGLGTLGQLIKSREESKHWTIDGIDGDISNCHNKALFDKKFYRNIWHGMAQELPSEVFRQYDIICLLDVIEHLDAKLPNGYYAAFWPTWPMKPYFLSARRFGSIHKTRFKRVI
jgi:2-polyprenyl-3-methyl-5-hydroxy-6-metoxy-1,4-benzoquinol methylase